MYLSQWTFFIVATATFNATYSGWKSIELWYLGADCTSKMHVSGTASLLQQSPESDTLNESFNREVQLYCPENPHKP